VPRTPARPPPERTVIRDVDQALPIVLAGVALMIALVGTGFVLVLTRTMQRHPLR
jgi:CHASE1-domain containing sensor protein